MLRSFLLLLFFLYFGEFYPAVTAPPRFRPCIARLIPFPYKERERQRAAKQSKKNKKTKKLNLLRTAASLPFYDAHREAPGTVASFQCLFMPLDEEPQSVKIPLNSFEILVQRLSEGRKEVTLCLRNSSRATTVLNYKTCELTALHVFPHRDRNLSWLTCIYAGSIAKS